ncbi:MAG: GYF domain-containing protein [Gemmataceae bacterium]
MATQVWYYLRNQQQQETTFDQLQQMLTMGTLKPTDLVWTETMTEWQQVQTIPDLNARKPSDDSLTNAQVAVLPDEKTTDQSKPTEHEKPRRVPRYERRSSLAWLWIAMSVGLALFVVCGFFTFSMLSPQNEKVLDDSGGNSVPNSPKIRQGRIRSGRTIRHTFHLKGGTHYTITSTSKNAGTGLTMTLVNAGGAVVSRTPTGFGFIQSRMYYYCPRDGEYTVQGKIDPQFAGLKINQDYEIDVTHTRPRLIQLTDGQLDVPGNVNWGETTFYRVQFEEGQRYTIDLKSPNLDAYLELYSPDGRLHSDDDGGPGQNSKIVFTPKTTGEYILAARDLQYQPGNFNVQIRKDFLGKLPLQNNRATIKDTLAPGQVKNYDVTLQAKQRYIVDISSTDNIQPALQFGLVSDIGRQFPQRTSGDRTLPAGILPKKTTTYRLKVLKAKGKGRFELKIKPYVPENLKWDKNNVAQVQGMAFGIEETIHLLPMDKQHNYKVQVTGKRFTPSLSLRTNDGKAIGVRNRHFGLHSRGFNFHPEKTAQYQIVVSNLSPKVRESPFVLRVEKKMAVVLRP